MMRTALQTLVVFMSVAALATCGPQSRGSSNPTGDGGNGGGNNGGDAGGGDNGGGNNGGDNGGAGDGDGGNGDGGADIDIIPDGGAGGGDDGNDDGGDNDGGDNDGGDNDGGDNDGGDNDGGDDGGDGGDALCGDAPEVEDDGNTPTPCDSDGIECDNSIGQGCTSDRDNAGSYKCDIMGPNREGQPCGQALGGCFDGLICVNFGEGGICMRMCSDDDNCPGDRQCNGSDINGSEGQFLTKTCGAGPAGCNPYCSEAHCPDRMGCYGSQDAGFSCRPPSADAVGAGESCAGEEENTYDPARCQIGHYCQSDVNPPVCRKICHLANDSEDCPGDQICQGFITLQGGMEEVRYCI